MARRSVGVGVLEGVVVEEGVEGVDFGVVRFGGGSS